MKRTSLLLIVSLLSIDSVFSQVKFGIKGGWDLIDVSIDGDIGEKLTASDTYGFFAGVMVDAKLPLLPIGMDISVLYNKREITLNEETEKCQFIVVPVNAKFSFGLGSFLGAYLSTGPQLSFNIGEEDLFRQLMNWEGMKGRFQLSESQFSWNFGAGVRLLNHFQVGYTYNIALGNTGEFKYLEAGQELSAGELYNKYHQISVAYLF